ncbi:6895_t:CDS:1, partial [Racocetra fulgida]
MVKLGDAPANYYPPSQTELEEQLSCTKKDRKVAIYWRNQFANNYDVLDREKKHIQDSLNQSKKENKHIQDDLDKSKKENKRIQDDLDKFKKDNEKLSDRVHQLGEETMR